MVETDTRGERKCTVRRFDANGAAGGRRPAAVEAGGAVRVARPVRAADARASLVAEGAVVGRGPHAVPQLQNVPATHTRHETHNSDRDGGERRVGRAARRGGGQLTPSSRGRRGRRRRRRSSAAAPPPARPRRARTAATRRRWRRGARGPGTSRRAARAPR